MIAVGPHSDPRFFEGIAAFASEAGYTLNAIPWALGRLTAQMLGGSAGLIGIFGRGHETALAEARKFALPLVSMGVPPKKNVLPAVCQDFCGIGRLAAEHLIECGYRRLLVCADSPEIRDGALAAAKQAGVEAVAVPSENLVDTAGKSRRESGPVGLIVTPDPIAAMCIARFHEASLAVPEDVGLVSAGNMAMLCDHTPVPLTSVDPDHRQVGYEAARLMHRILTGKRVPQTPAVVPPLGVIKRRSTDYVVTGRPEVLAAVRYIREHFTERIGADDIVAASGLKRRRLDQLFLACLGRTVAKELDRYRVQVVSELLVQTDLPCETISRQCGFNEAPAMFRSFRRYMHCTPGQYRARNAQQPEP